eukprot:Sdes_comp15281_c0_seq1m4131
MPASQICYSDKYYDEEYEYRHVILPSDIAKVVPKNRLLSESEWRNLGVQQSRGWVHYMIHKPEPHILLFRRPTVDNPVQKAKLEKEALQGLHVDMKKQQKQTQQSVM